MERPLLIYIHILQGVHKKLPDSKADKIFLTLFANIINLPRLGYCVQIELYTRTVSFQAARFSLVSMGDDRENYEHLCK